MALAPIQEAGHLFGVVCSLQDISKLKEVERMKDAFVSNVSHELRTPITSIKLNQRLIQMNPDGQPVYLERMGREINRLNDLIEDLLRLSRLDQGRAELDLAPVNLNDLVDEHVGDRSPIAESRSLSLSAEKKVGLPEVQADRGLLGQALSVLLTNALNYTPPGGSIRIRTAARQKGGEKWVGFVVSDTGPGIPREERPHLFERFYRGKIGRDSGMPGTGLGLAIAHEIVSRHGGRIEVSHARAGGEGVTFSVWLPLKDSSDRQG
jgi:two-component system phosphate regulon sensor histidine kinase PhoR